MKGGRDEARGIELDLRIIEKDEELIEPPVGNRDGVGRYPHGVSW